MKEFNNILLFGGKTKNENLPIGFYSSLAMLPLKGKPVIWHMLENLKRIGITKYIIVECSNNTKLIEYTKNILKKHFDIELVKINNNKSILSSLKYALFQANPNIPTRVILGDTYIPSSINEEVDVLFSSKNITTSENWCLVQKDKNNLAERFYDKHKNINLCNKEALVGYYSFSDTKLLKECCVKARLKLKKEISDVLESYKKKQKLKVTTINDWYDLGHVSGLIKVKNLLYSVRCFNSISVDTNIGILTKSSTNIQKLEDEAFWYQNLPEDLKILAPRLINIKKNESTAELLQECYGYPSLQELYLSGEVNLEDWAFIIEKLFSLHKILESYKKEPNEEALLWLYKEKTTHRLNELMLQNSYWANICQKEYEFINNKKYFGIAKLKEKIYKLAEEISKTGNTGIMHGDYCFSNILFDANNYIFKLIDPRGRLNENPTIYGDPRYDIAKLRHSVVGLYDFVVQGLFSIEESTAGFTYKILTTRDYFVLENVFDRLCVKNGFLINEIKFIEGLLFLSMLPLHKDDFDRQKVIYLRAIELLNEVLKGTQ